MDGGSFVVKELHANRPLLAGLAALVTVVVYLSTAGSAHAPTPAPPAPTTPLTVLQPLAIPAHPPGQAEPPAQASTATLLISIPATDRTNYALASQGATAKGGRQPERLIDGVVSGYSYGKGFASAQWEGTPEPFLVTLKDARPLTCVRFLLWDLSPERIYRYRLEAAAKVDGPWVTLADHSHVNARCQSWQTIEFAPQIVQVFRLTGTYNSDNSSFHVVEFEAYASRPTDEKPTVVAAPPVIAVQPPTPATTTPRPRPRPVEEFEF